jgi:indole-3-glycerol phosphate synthase
MNSLLEQIIADTKNRVEVHRSLESLAQLSERSLFGGKCTSLKQRLVSATTPAVIAEFKRQSPSRGKFVGAASIQEVVTGYESAGAIGLSILTNSAYFGVSLDDLATVRSLVACPLLRKDFVIDEYQLYEAKAYGADVVLLIARCLSRGEIIELIHQAHGLGLETLLEVHDEADIEKCTDAQPSIWGINNRNLDTLAIDLLTTKKLLPMLPEDACIISESGLSAATELISARDWGVQGFLMGDHFLSTADAPATLSTLLQSTLTSVGGKWI